MGRLQSRRIKKGKQAIRNSDSVHEVILISDEGNVKIRYWDDSKLEERGYHSTPTNGNVYLEGHTNPVDELELPEDRDDFIKHGTIEGFIPCTEWKAFRDQKAISEAFNRKKSWDIPWMWVIAGVTCLIVVMIIVTQFATP